MANALRTQGQQHAPLSLSPLLREQDFGPYLVVNGLIDLKEMLRCKADARRSRASFTEILYASGLIDPRLLVEAEASFRGLTRADLASHPADPALAALCDPAFWLKHSAIPWGWHEDTLLIVVSDPASFATLAKALPPILQSAKPVLALQSEIDASIAAIFREELTARASARVPESESCRTWGRTPHRRITLLSIGLLALMAAVVLWPKVIVSALVLWAIFAMALSALHKISAVFAFLAFPDPPSEPPSELAQMPRILVLVPLFREPEIAQVLVRRISRLTYPKHLLDVVLVLEETDTITRDALENASFPPWMRKIIVPDGQPRTKPRAMNYALDFCQGDIIGIWDAEDAPEPHQLDLVAEKFRTAPPDLVCLQGALDFYNPKQNWLARCFTIEYASWFRTVLPGLCRLGFAIPLGGTTLFFRRDVLEQLGGWDAHNVTEDADLGFRLARHGYRTGMIATATGEEANCKAWPWVKQRSRWLKGYMVTYLAAMRSPVRLWRELGAWKFFGFQTHFITALSQFLLAPLLWSFWLIFFGLAHPLDGLVPREWILTMGMFFLGFECITVAIGAISVARPEHRHLLAWVPTLHLYFHLATLAGYKALWELLVAPFYWDKTTHGLSLTAGGKKAGASLDASQSP